MAQDSVGFVLQYFLLWICANKCALDLGCFSFYHSSVAQICLGCPFRFSLLNSTEDYIHYIPVKGQYDYKCGYFEYRSHYYSFNTDQLTEKEASNKCTQFGGHLVYVENESEHYFLANISRIIPGIRNKRFWIGAYLDPKVGDGKWRWRNGVKTEETFEDFGNFQPSGNGRCVVMGYGKGIWDDQPCSNRNKFICEIE